MNMLSNKQQILDKLFSLLRFGIKPGLERTNALLERLGSPQNKFPTIHIAGTNGKGTTASAIASILQEAGFKTGLFTSPHIIDFNERIKINGRQISDDEIIALANPMFEASDEIGCTFFEISTAMAFKYFEDNNVDIAIIEVGMGGRFDSTNVLKPLVSVITQIGLDHIEYLGKSLSEIAFEKAGIIKENTPVIIADNHTEIQKIFINIAKEKNSPLQFLDSAVQPQEVIFNSNLSMTAAFDLSMFSELFKLENPVEIQIPFAGKHQLRNIQTALLALSQVQDRFPFSKENIINGIKNIKKNCGLFGRIELVREEPPLIIDVSHNYDAVKMLVHTIKLCGYHNPNWVVVYGAMDDKDAEAMLLELRAVTKHLILTQPTIQRAKPIDNLVEIAENMNFKNITAIKDCKEAFECALSLDEPLLAAGSFYLIGEIMPVLTKHFNFKFM